MTELPHFLTIGEVAARSGVAASALRFYEEQGLISSERTSGNQRRYPRAVLRRVAVMNCTGLPGEIPANIVALCLDPLAELCQGPVGHRELWPNPIAC